MNSLQNTKISSLAVCRKPIAKALNVVMNLITLGKFNQTKKDLKYDDMFHLYILMKLENGRNLLLEKNQVVNIVDYKSEIDKDCLKIQLNKSLTFTQFLINGEKFQGSTFWQYDPKTNNCQNFVLSCLKGNNLGNESVYKFVKQDAEALVSGFSHTLSKGITNLAGRLDILFKGYGLENLANSYFNQLYKQV